MLSLRVGCQPEPGLELNTLSKTIYLGDIQKNGQAVVQQLMNPRIPDAFDPQKKAIYSKIIEFYRHVLQMRLDPMPIWHHS